MTHLYIKKILCRPLQGECQVSLHLAFRYGILPWCRAEKLQLLNKLIFRWDKIFNFETELLQESQVLWRDGIRISFLPQTLHRQYCDDSTFTYWPSNSNWQDWLGSRLQVLSIGWLPPKHSLIHFTALFLLFFFFFFSSLTFHLSTNFVCIFSLCSWSLLFYTHILCVIFHDSSHLFCSFSPVTALSPPAAQSMAAAGACILPAASYDHGDSTEGGGGYMLGDVN